ncbi:hypothetical protein JCM5353_000351 [Sporobolomyces roseus]
MAQPENSSTGIGGMDAPTFSPWGWNHEYKDVRELAAHTGESEVLVRDLCGRQATVKHRVLELFAESQSQPPAAKKRGKKAVPPKVLEKAISGENVGDGGSSRKKRKRSLEVIPEAQSDSSSLKSDHDSLNPAAPSPNTSQVNRVGHGERDGVHPIQTGSNSASLSKSSPRVTSSLTNRRNSQTPSLSPTASSGYVSSPPLTPVSSLPPILAPRSKADVLRSIKIRKVPNSTDVATGLPSGFPPLPLHHTSIGSSASNSSHSSLTEK